MHADEHTVAGQPDIALERVRAVLDRTPVGRKRVLRLVGGGTTVGDDLRPDGHVSMLTRDGEPANRRILKMAITTG